MQAKPGDRIELLSMPNDPCPIPVGTKGTVEWVNECKDIGFTQVSVKWDIPRSLLLTVPPDRFRIVKE